MSHLANDSLRIQSRFRSFLMEMATVFSHYPELQEHAKSLEQIAASVCTPFSVAVFGRVKAGKSSLVNSLIGRPLAIVGSEEATATINKISYAEAPMTDSFRVHWKDSEPVLFPLDHLQRDWTGKDAEVIQRVQRASFLELFADAETLKHVHIVDTPGTGSVNDDHERVAQSFLSMEDSSIAEGEKADALLYVFGYLGKESDEQSLASFRKGCVPGSNPYNSVGVFHLWDATYWDNGGDWADIEAKALRLQNDMQGVVSQVIPVSAPIASFSKLASREILQRLLDFIHGEAFENAMEFLKRDTRWDKDSVRAELRESCAPLPWPSFRIAVRHLYQQKVKTINECRSSLRALSRMDQLESFLDIHFFRQASVIKLRQNRAKSTRVMQKASDVLENKLVLMEEDLSQWRQLNMIVRNPSLLSWVENKKVEIKEEIESIQQELIRADKFQIAETKFIEQLDQDMELMRDKSSAFPNMSESDLVCMEQLLSYLHEGYHQSSKLACDVDAFHALLRALAQISILGVDKKERDNAHYMKLRLSSLYEYFNII